MKKITVGIVAHVDAGKTTLTEAMLYTSGAIRKLGRVDKRDSFLDNGTQERKRGITIFSKQARLQWKDAEITILDTPGHADFSAEMERTLSVLDCAVLVISGTDGTQAHTRTVAELLLKNRIPVMIFVTKMDVSSLDRQTLLDDLKSRISPFCTDMDAEDLPEQLAMLDEKLLDAYMETGAITQSQIRELFTRCALVPVRFGSGLKLEGVERLLDDIIQLNEDKPAQAEFSARVFKISHDSQGKRLTHIRLTGGEISVRDSINGEKISQIRMYSGPKFEPADRVSQGDVCTLLGLNSTFAGQGLGSDDINTGATIQPVLEYTVKLLNSSDILSALQKLRLLEEEDPTLHIEWNERAKKIGIQLMGPIQTEILKEEIRERFGLEAEFESGHILYKETIAAPVEGVGHYEPLKHYAEVHLLLEPLARNSGLIFETDLPVDELDLNWQRLIMTHLMEKQYRGVLTASPITDMKISLLAGRAHLKHTEGGDFRQATYRAVRNGLMKAESILLEPVFSFTLEIPQECTGRAMTDLHGMGADYSAPMTRGETAEITGTAPARRMSDYITEVISYTGGRGRLSCTPAGYRECREPEKIITETAYSAENDIEDSPDSVFCAHGGSFNVKWNEVEKYCHIPCMKTRQTPEEPPKPVIHERRQGEAIDEAELEAIMLREFGPIKRKTYTEARVYSADAVKKETKTTRVIIDGYNLIFADEKLKETAVENIDAAREKLINKLVNYTSYTGREVILVFDAYAVPQGRGSKSDEAKLHLVYTKEGETADAYIEKIADETGRNENLKVVSSDSMVQLAALRSGVIRISAREFMAELETALAEMRDRIKNK